LARVWISRANILFGATSSPKCSTKKAEPLRPRKRIAADDSGILSADIRIAAAPNYCRDRFLLMLQMGEK